MLLKNYLRACKWLAVILPAAVCAQGIHLTPGAHLVMSGNINLVLNNGGLITNGNFNPGQSTIILNGTGSTQPGLGGSVAASFHRIIINRQADVMLKGNITIDDTLTMIKGNLQLNNYTLNLNGYISGENDQSSVTGTGGGLIRVTTKLRAPHQVNPGNIGIEITSAATLGTTIIVRRHIQQTLANGVQSIQRYFQISPATNTQLNATLRFFYLDKELAGANESALTGWKGADLGNYWLLSGRRDSVDVRANYLVITGIDHFTRYTLGPETATVTMARIAPSDSLRKVGSFKPITTMQVYPNPLHDQFILALFSDSGKEYTIGLYNQFGHLLQVKKVQCHAGMNQINWNLSEYATGVYYLVFAQQGMQNIKLIKK